MNKTKLKLGFSPCPNDTFVFDAMVHGRIDTEGLEFDYFLADVEELNSLALSSGTDITKMSFYAFAFAAKNYLILDSGSALGHHNGPLVISKRKITASGLAESTIAIPGKYTTANLLFSLIWPEAINKVEYLFSGIEDALLAEEVDAGLIIHETRFTYRNRGLHKIVDLGEYWENLTGLPIPLGTIAVNRTIDIGIALKVNSIIRRIVEFAHRHPKASHDFIKTYASEMDSSVVNRHIKLFVNRYTTSLGNGGKKAITELFRIAGEKGIIPEMPERIFLTSR